MNNFGDIIKKLREEKSYSQEALAEELNISKSTVAMWETNKRYPSKELYEQVADLFNVDIDYLYGRTNIRKKIHYDLSGGKYIHSDFVREESAEYNADSNTDGKADINTDDYYFDDETKKIAQEIFENKELRILFDIARNTSKDRLIAYANFLKELHDKDQK